MPLHDSGPPLERASPTRCERQQHVAVRAATVQAQDPCGLESRSLNKSGGVFCRPRTAQRRGGRMEMGRERPRSPPAIFAPRPANGVAHAPLSVPTMSGRM